MLKSAVDQMRHFLWFYMQIMTNESELTDRLRQAIRQRTSGDSSPSPDAALLKDFETIGNTALLQFFDPPAKCASLTRAFAIPKHSTNLLAIEEAQF